MPERVKRLSLHESAYHSRPAMIETLVWVLFGVAITEAASPLPFVRAGPVQVYIQSLQLPLSFAFLSWLLEKLSRGRSRWHRLQRRRVMIRRQS